MALVLNGSGITSANIADGTIVNADVADVAASKLTGALPAIDGSALTGMPAVGADTSLSNLSSTGEQLVCTAWVNFNATTTPPTINDSYNVSSVVRTSTGYFTINFTTAMDNANYSACVGGAGVGFSKENSSR